MKHRYMATLDFKCFMTEASMQIEESKNPAKEFKKMYGKDVKIKNIRRL